MIEDKQIGSSTSHKFNFDVMWLGVLLGIFAPLLFMLGYYLIYYNYMSVAGFVRYINGGNVVSELLSLSLMSNLLVFFIFIWTEKYQAARGVLLSTFLYALPILYFKFIQ